MLCFIVSLISFASYIITNYMHDVRFSHLNKDYLLTYLIRHWGTCRLKFQQLFLANVRCRPSVCRLSVSRAPWSGGKIFGNFYALCYLSHIHLILYHLIYLYRDRTMNDFLCKSVQYSGSRNIVGVRSVA